MEKVTKAFSYSFNVLHVSHASVEGSTGKIDDWITGVKYFKWEHFSYEFLLCKKYLFIWNNYNWSSIEGNEGAIKPLQRNKTLKVLTKS